jgi:hypothetical protein
MSRKNLKKIFNNEFLKNDQQILDFTGGGGVVPLIVEVSTADVKDVQEGGMLGPAATRGRTGGVCVLMCGLGISGSLSSL